MPYHPFRSITLFFLASIVLIALYHQDITSLLPAVHMSSSQSQFSNWHNRADSVPNPHSFILRLDRSTLRLLVLRNSKVENEGFTLALFDESEENVNNYIAVDAQGKVLSVDRKDFEGFMMLVEQLKSLPSTQSFRNTWMIAQPRTGQPIDRLLVPKLRLPPTSDEDYKNEYTETSVQGFEKGMNGLKNPVEGFDTLPGTLQEMMELVIEARAEIGAEKDEVVLTRIKAIIGNNF